jgi:cellulose synthase/poly-beta-1,6-N-acetylglucosamine synthase-like glycosyltransferase
VFEGTHPLYAVAGNACYRTEQLRQLGGFPVYGADDAALGIVARAHGLRFAWAPDAVVRHANPIGWRGYAGQMRKVGRYSAELSGPPARWDAWWLERGRHLAGALRPLLAGDVMAAVCGVTASVSQTAGARDAWRSDPRPPLPLP